MDYTRSCYALRRPLTVSVRWVSKREAPTGALEGASRLAIVVGVDFLTLLQTVEAEECRCHH